MKKAAIFMSDFHLGQQDRMEEFHADEEFSELLDRLSREHRGDDVDLVLLGDVMDLWTTITDDKEINARSAQDVDIYFPVTSDNRNQAVQKELEKVKAIMGRHAEFFSALHRFLAAAPARQLFYIPGNHDHSVVAQELRDEIQRSIANQDQTVADRIHFPYWYENDLLQVYAEHGNQLTYGGAFKYENFSQFGEECPGYFELKLVWNRLERRAPELDNVFMGALSPAMWPGLFWWLLMKGNLRHLRTLKRFAIQYDHDARAADARRKMPKPWKSLLHLLRSRRSATGDEFWDQIPQLFDDKGKGLPPLRGRRLNPVETKTVVLGHSHQTKDKQLPGLEGVKYYNTGSWIFRYENGRRIVEQTWLTVSREQQPAGGPSGLDHPIIERKLSRRRVELPRVDASPVTKDGRTLNPAMRMMPDLRVGDVALVHWNFRPTVTRLLKSGQVLELIREIPQMIGSWLNRYGSSAYWSHAALVYGSPFERQESDEYNDPLLLEALPDTGVGIHGPSHYLARPGEWNVAVLRAKAPWLNDWQNRRLLRRMAVSALDTYYDNQEIARQTLRFSTKMMDQQDGQAFVTGLFKGGLMGVVLSTSLLLIWGLWTVARKVGDAGWAELWKAVQRRFAVSSETNADRLDLWGLPDAAANVLGSHDLFLIAVGLGAGVVVAGAVALALIELARLIWRTWMLITGAIGAAWGALIVPVMAELADGWETHSVEWRWVFTGLWMTIPLAALVSWFQSYNAKEVAATLLFVSILVVWGSYPLTFILEYVVIKPWELILRGNKALWRRLSKPLGWTQLKQLQKEPHFMCSGLVQYAFGITARQLKTTDPAIDIGAVVVNPGWKEGLPLVEQDQVLRQTVHQQFADAKDRFEWIYLHVDGVTIHNPSPSHMAEVEPDRLGRIRTRRLSQAAAWSLRIALLGFYCTTAYELAWHREGLLLAGAFFGLAAVCCARIAQRDLALNPETVRGRWLSRWGGRLGYTAIAAALLAGVGL
jgi:UDP-2,3-diacylglucosamine pyrophosphatase LpxH